MTAARKLHPLSGRGDLTGGLYIENSRIFRAIWPGAEPLVRRILNAPSVQRLIDEGKIQPSRVVNHTIDTCRLVLEHDPIDPITYPEEWCDAMIASCAKLILEINDALIDDDLILYDVHPWNFLFHNGTPLLVDIGAIQDSERHTNNWPYFSGYWRFRQTYLNSLKLIHTGKEIFARGCLIRKGRILDHLVEPATPAEYVSRWLRNAAKRHLPAWAKSHLRKGRSILRRAPVAHATPHERTRRTLVKLGRELNAIQRTTPMAPWTRYYDRHGLATSVLAHKNAWTQKQQTVWKLLNECTFDSVFDAGANTGWYSLLLASTGKRVISCDAENDCMSMLYAASRARGLDIHPVVMDVMQPTPGTGLPARRTAPAEDRLRSDLVLALALIHHLSLTQRLRLSCIIEALAAFSRRYLLVEWVEVDDQSVQSMPLADSPWYTKSEFERALQARFTIVKQAPSTETRELYLCELRST